MRLKNRYLFGELVWHLNEGQSPPNIRAAGFVKAIQQTLIESFGQLGGHVPLALKHLNPSTRTFILRCSRSHFQTVWAAMTLTTNILGVDASIRVLNVAGSARTCTDFAVSYTNDVLIGSCHLALAPNQRTALKQQQQRELTQISAMDKF
eukprot:c2067_g1_i1.p1 GENE.c2067_g1_i1~~c2067_g1_i1.p1  ORF type:complete len:150 (+),score=26.23 c2067_g1_i1:14-463(+)